MWKIFQELLIVAVFIIILSQLVLPVFFGSRMKFFWIFSKQGRADVFAEKQADKPQTLQDRLRAIKPIVEDVKSEVTGIQQEANEELKKAKTTKKETDNLI